MWSHGPKLRYLTKGNFKIQVDSRQNNVLSIYESSTIYSSFIKLIVKMQIDDLLISFVCFIFQASKRKWRHVVKIGHRKETFKTGTIQ